MLSLSDFSTSLHSNHNQSREHTPPEPRSTMTMIINYLSPERRGEIAFDKGTTMIISTHIAWVVIISLHVLVIVVIWLRIPGLSTLLHHSTSTTAAVHSRPHTVAFDTEEQPDDQYDDPSQYRILMMHYHKTGFVLSRQLRRLAEKNLLRFDTLNATNDIHNSTIFRIPEKNWGSIQRPRQFNFSTKCQDTYHLEGGLIHVQESPDLFCNVDALVDILLNEDDIRTSRETRIIHFVRNPYSMALSNYFYHSQDPT